MKRILFLCLILMIVSLVTPMSAYATTDVEKDIDKITQSNELVTDSVSIVANNIAVIAVKTKAVTRTEYWEMKTSITDAIKQKYADITQVYVTNNVKVYFTIEQLNKLPEDKRQEQVEKILDKLSKIPMPFNQSQAN